MRAEKPKSVEKAALHHYDSHDLDKISERELIFAVNSTYTIASGQREFPSMVKRAEEGELAVVTRHDKPVAYVISAERMESILETMELLANPEFAGALQVDRSGSAKYHPLDSIKDE